MDLICAISILPGKAVDWFWVWVSESLSFWGSIGGSRLGSSTFCVDEVVWSSLQFLLVRCSAQADRGRPVGVIG